MEASNCGWVSGSYGGQLGIIAFSPCFLSASGWSNLRSNKTDNTHPASTSFHHLCYQRLVRHFVIVACCNGYFSCKVRYDTNAACSFNLRCLILSGDICVNPRPEQSSVCSKTIVKNHQAVCCDKFDSWWHAKCRNVLPKECKFQQVESFNWICPPCTLITLFFSNTHYNVDHRYHFDMETNVNVNSHKGLKCFLANARSFKSKFQDFHAIGFAEHNLMYFLIQKPRLMPVFWTTK